MSSLAVDGLGRLYVAWEDTRAGDRDLWLVASDDGGVTWEPELRIDSDAAGSGVSYHPQLLVWNDGTVLVADGLPATLQIDDAQAPGAQAHRPLEVKALVVGPAVPEAVGHGVHCLAVRR